MPVQAWTQDYNFYRSSNRPDPSIAQGNFNLETKNDPEVLSLDQEQR